MNALESIPITIETAAGPGGVTENALPLLHEIRHALKRLQENGEPTQFDLRAIPFAPGDEERLLNLLGQGEVEAVVDALGESKIIETSFPGVWVVSHYSPENERIAFQIEVTDIPEILKTQQADLEDSFLQLSDALETES
ncbi:MAG: hydrogenase expression/formation C-terminal domain-containing protein [Candidatus Sedimenticola sp. 6PFRAG7]